MTAKSSYERRTNQMSKNKRYEFIIKSSYQPKGIGFKPSFTKKEVITNG